MGDEERFCGFDGAACTTALACHAARSCAREQRLEERGFCTECSPPQRFADARARAAHRRVHEEPEPCPHGCGKPVKPSGLKKHEGFCPQLAPRVTVDHAAVAERFGPAAPPAEPAGAGEVRSWRLELASGSTVELRIRVAGSFLAEPPEAREALCALSIAADRLAALPERTPA